MNKVQNLNRSLRTIPILLLVVTFVFCCFYLKTCQCMVPFHPIPFQTITTKKTGYMRDRSSGHKRQSDKKKDEVSHIMSKTPQLVSFQIESIQALHD